MAADFSRVSRKLHLRNGRRTVSLAFGLASEVAAAMFGAILLALSLRLGSNSLAIAAAVIWATTFQPLLKFAAGRMLGVEYEYLYFFLGSEPRLKMRYGTYLALPRSSRVVLHLCGIVGSPLGFVLPALYVHARLPVAEITCLVLFFAIVTLNLGLFIAGLMDVRAAGKLKSMATSGGMAGLELREALRW